MPEIHLTTFIAAPIERVFDLSRSVELHKLSMKKYKEEAVAGTRSGLMENDDFVVWKARHFFRSRFLKMRVADLKKPEYFLSEQVEGSFRKFRHEHYFKSIENGTILIDKLYYEMPLGFIGRIQERVLLTRYLKKLLTMRNNVIREVAERG